MDEITVFSTLRPQSPADLGPLCQQAEARLDQAMRTTKPGRAPRPRRNRLLLAGAVVVAACAAIVAPAVIPGNDSGSFVTSAWAVQPSPDGSVRITFHDVADPAGLQRALRSDGIQARVMSPAMKVASVKGSPVQYATCIYPSSGPLFASARIQQTAVTWNPSVAGAVAIIHPSAMPTGSVLFITDIATNTVGMLSRPAVLKSNRLPACRPVSKP
jgi:hypothetical protein